MVSEGGLMHNKGRKTIQVYLDEQLLIFYLRFDLEHRLQSPKLPPSHLLNLPWIKR